MAGANIGMMVCLVCFLALEGLNWLTTFPCSLRVQDPAYFTGRKVIVQWLNETFHMNVSKIEETASGEYVAFLVSRWQELKEGKASQPHGPYLIQGS